MLENWMKALRGAGRDNGPAGPEIVLSMPPALRPEIEGALPVTKTYDAFAKLFSSARRTLKIFVPYVDPTFTALVSLTQAPVRVLTTKIDKRGAGASPVLERCSTLRDLQVRYLNERRDKALMYQIHAKMLIADGECAYVGSANLTDTSIHYNLEMGVLLRDGAIIAQLERLFDRLFDRMGVPAKLL